MLSTEVRTGQGRPWMRSLAWQLQLGCVQSLQKISGTFAGVGEDGAIPECRDRAGEKTLRLPDSCRLHCHSQWAPLSTVDGAMGSTATARSSRCEQTSAACTITTCITLDVRSSTLTGSSLVSTPASLVWLLTACAHADNRRLDEWVTVDRLNLRTYEPEEEIGPDGR